LGLQAQPTLFISLKNINVNHLNILVITVNIKGMIILFIHRNFPAQFKNIAAELAKNPKNLVIFLTSNTDVQLQGINKIVYTPKLKTSCNNPYLNIYEDAVLHGQAAGEMMEEIKKRGVKPDIIYGHSWGPSMFAKDIFPDVPYLAYFEWFSKGKDSAYDFVNVLDADKTSRIRCNNSQILIDLYSCDAGISPTEWQKKQFPQEFQEKINVIHDGIDTEACKPNPDAKFCVAPRLHSILQQGSRLGLPAQQQGTEMNASGGQPFVLTAQDEVITYTTRGMEALRGFPQFMEAVEKLSKRRPSAHFVIAGEDKIFYGAPAPEGTYKEYMLKKLNLDMNRVHFVGNLPFDQYLSLLQISSAHIYLTYPFVLSWSILEAMSCGCPVIGSDTPPVKEVIKDNYNGFLIDFFEVESLCKKIEYVLENSAKMQEIRTNARKIVLEKYDKNILLPKHIELIEKIINK
jgi:glycosyltransferase involved in cell wall biosynthesis